MDDIFQYDPRFFMPNLVPPLSLPKPCKVVIAFNGVSFDTEGKSYHFLKEHPSFSDMLDIAIRTVGSSLIFPDDLTRVIEAFKIKSVLNYQDLIATFNNTIKFRDVVLPISDFDKFIKSFQELDEDNKEFYYQVIVNIFNTCEREVGTFLLDSLFDLKFTTDFDFSIELPSRILKHVENHINLPSFLYSRKHLQDTLGAYLPLTSSDVLGEKVSVSINLRDILVIDSLAVKVKSFEVLP